MFDDVFGYTISAIKDDRNKWRNLCSSNVISDVSIHQVK